MYEKSAEDENGGSAKVGKRGPSAESKSNENEAELVVKHVELLVSRLPPPDRTVSTVSTPRLTLFPLTISTERKSVTGLARSTRLIYSSDSTLQCPSKPTIVAPASRPPGIGNRYCGRDARKRERGGHYYSCEE